MTREIFLLKNHTQIEMEKLIPDPLINKKSKIATPLDQQSKTSSLFLLCPSGSLPKCIKTKVLTTCVDLI